MKPSEFRKKYPTIFEMPLKQEQDLSVSVIIPCHHTDAYLLKNLLQIYTLQTVLPSEVIISLSGMRLMAIKQKKKIRKWIQWSSKLPFSVKWITHLRNKLPGGNKNAACNLATGDVIIVQDSDDIPHIQRTQIIKWWFDHCDINHLGHTFVQRYKKSMIRSGQKYRKIKFNQHQFGNIGKMNFYRRIPEIMTLMPKKIRVKITNGEVAFLRSLFSEDEIRWDPTISAAEDTRFNRLVERKYRKSINLTHPLIIYNRVKQRKR